MTTRTETDSLGTIEIAADALWGPQTERARRLFAIGSEKFPSELIRAVGIQKRAAARANLKLGELPEPTARLIDQAAGEVMENRLDAHFPLHVWQTGSGTQTNMNANEVISNRAAQLAGKQVGERSVHPNDHVNRGQSSNDSFPAIMHIAAAEAVERRLIPALATLHESLARRATEWAELIKIGRTHLMDAVPVTFGQEFSAYARQVELGIARLQDTLPRLWPLAQGGTAAGTGLNTHPDFAETFAAEVAELTGLPFVANTNPSEGMGAHDALMELSGQMNVIATALNKIGNDIRMLGSGPRAGLAELIVPADGLSSSIMPGKTNPTQCEALTMVAAQVMGNNVAVTVGAAQGQLELNVFKPVIIHNVLQSARLLADAAESFAANMVDKLEPNRPMIERHLANSLMLVTALNPHIGYDRSVRIAKKALAEHITLREAAAALGYVTPEDFDRWVDPRAMLKPHAGQPAGG
ncbi:MAG: class II fumarate hydratase [Acetobacteraceae bacterium]|nr:class II fumarate hydratase [Acetobacteraceae bacterium]